MATVRCEEIANEKLASFVANEVPAFLSIYIKVFVHCHFPFPSMFIYSSLNTLHDLIFLQEWCELDEAIQTGPVSGFGKKLTSILHTCLSEYVHIL